MELVEQNSPVLSRENRRALEELRRWSDNGRAVANRARVLAQRLVAGGVPLDDVAEAMGISASEATSCLLR